jgi:hypothetical protein
MNYFQTIRPSAEERLAARKTYEAMLIARIDEALDGGPKLQNPPMYRDEELTLDFTKIIQLLSYRQRCRLSAQIAYEKRLHLASKRNLG